MEANKTYSAFSSELLRVFIGIECDKQFCERSEELIKPLKKSLPNTRWVPQINQHMTLAFLGEISNSSVEKLMAGFDQAYRFKTRFTYRFTRLCRFPGSTGGIVALEGKPEGPVHSLYQSTLNFLNTVHLEPVRKEFRPHITLGRIRKPESVRSEVDQNIDVKLDVTKITFYQSTLTEKGSIYKALKESRLC